MTAILEALLLALAQLPQRELRRALVATLFWTTLLFVAGWSLVWFEFRRVESELGAYGPVVGAGAGILALLLTWFLFVTLENTILFCYSNSIIAAVERRHYPLLVPVGPTRWRDLTQSGVRLLLLTIAGNIVVLPLYLLLPGANLVLFLGLNGYLLGRAYFDTVALRRMDDRTARRLWNAEKMPFILNGAVSAALLLIPVVNLVVPIVGLATAVHLLLRRRAES